MKDKELQGNLRFVLSMCGFFLNELNFTVLNWLNVEFLVVAALLLCLKSFKDLWQNGF